MRLEWIKITTRQRLIGYNSVILYYYHATKNLIYYNDWSVIDEGERKGSLGMSRKIKNFQHSFLTMTKSHNENGIDDKTLEIEAGKAKAPELALHLEELNKKNQKKTIRQAKNNLDKRRILLLHWDATHHWPSLGPPMAFFCFIFVLFFRPQDSVIDTL